MTKQDKRSIRFGGGYTGKIPLRKFDYPPDRVTEFLRLDIQKDDEILNYCSNYQLVIFNIDTLLKRVKIEQSKMARVANKFFNNELIDKQELNHINRRLGNIKLNLSYPARGDELELHNSPKAIRDKFNRHEFEIAKNYPDPFSSLWEDLITHFLKKRDVRNCINCGNYFVRLNKQDSLFCSTRCKNNLHQERNRAKKRKLKDKK